jgi:hypothetical protein
LRRYTYGLLIALDQLVNALLGGYPDETVSLRAERARRGEKRWGCALCRVLDWIDPEHCKRAAWRKSISVRMRKL